MNLTSANNSSPTEECEICLLVIDPYIVPIITILGILGNILSTIVILSTSMRNVPSSIHLIGLSSADAVFLLVFNLVTKGGCYSHGMCQLCIFAQYASTFWSVWLLVSFTAERFIAVVFPMQQLRLSNWSVTRRIIASVLVMGCVISSPWLYIAVYQPEERLCSYRITPVAGAMLSVISYLETVATFFLPLLIICILNFMIARAVARSNKGPGYSRADPEPANSAAQRRRERTSTGITRTLFIVSLVFVFCNLPTYIIQTILKVKMRSNAKISQRLLLARQFSEYLYYLNFTLNFLLYTFSSSGFRESLKQLVQKVFCRSVRGSQINRDTNSIKLHLKNIDIPKVYSRRMLEANKEIMFNEVSQNESLCM